MFSILLFFLVQNFINQVFCGSYTIIKAKFKFYILQTSLKKEGVKSGRRVSGVTTGLGNSAVDFCANSTLLTHLPIQGMTIHIGEKKQENYL